MTVERTEEDGLAALLIVSMGGKPYRLRTLPLVESDAWLDLLGSAMSAVDVMETSDGDQMLRSMLKSSSAAMLRLLVAYDHDGVLGGADAIRERMTKRELSAALDGMVTAEDPSGEATARSVAAAFGEPSRLLEAGMRVVAEPLLRLVKSPSSPSASGDSTTPGTSDPDGQESNSSSTGPTPSSERGAKPKSKAS